MSAYTNETDLLGEIQLADLIWLTDDKPTTGNVNQTVLNQVIANASGEIDFYLANRYSVPLVPTPPMIESAAIAITCYKLFRRREVPDEKNKYKEQYDNAIKTLQAIKAGDEAIDVNVNQAFSPVQYNQRATIFGYSPVYVPNSM